MKKIAILINSNKLGGAEKVVQTIVKNICNDFEIHLVTIEKNDFFEPNINIYNYHLSKSTGRKNKFLKFFDLIPLAIKLKKYLKNNNINLVQSHLFRANYINILAKLFGSNHQVQIVDHTLTERLSKEGISGKINKILIKYLYPFANLSISVSHLVNQQLNVLTQLPINNIVINNPFDLKNIKKKSLEAIDDFVFNDNIFYIVLVGRINSIKNYELVINALNIINNKKLHLLIIGNEEDITVSKLVNPVFHKDAIHYIGEKDNPFKYIRQCDLLVVSSDSESFGNILIESMICQTPIISSDCGGPREILAPNCSISTQFKDDIELAEFGILFPIGDVMNLVKGIRLMIEDDEVRKSYIMKSQQRAKDFSIEKIITQYKKVIIDEK